MTAFTVNSHRGYMNIPIVIKAEGMITIEDIPTGQKYEFRNELKTRLSAGWHILQSGEYRELVFIEDAIKLGGSRVKRAFVFDGNPWAFVTTKDRLYAINTETHDEKVEYGITPDEIESLPSYMGAPNVFFLFKTQHDYAIYNVLTGIIVCRFTEYIFANDHLVVFEQENGVEVFDFRKACTVVHFMGQYSFGNKLYFVKDQILFGLDLCTSCISEIPYVGKVKDSDMLLGNHLLRLYDDSCKKKLYLYFSLGDGGNVSSMACTRIDSPYYIGSWNGKITPHFSKAKADLQSFAEQCSKVSSSFPNVRSLCFGVRITKETCHLDADGNKMVLHGEIMSYPACGLTIPFKAEGQEGRFIDLAKYELDINKAVNADIDTKESRDSVVLCKDERLIGESKSGNLIVTKAKDKIYLRNLSKGEKYRILQNLFDSSIYKSAYFTGDGKNVFLRLNADETKLLSLDSMESKTFEVDGFTLARNAGYNGYKPELVSFNGQGPIWRDPITLNLVREEDMSNHVFKSPDGRYMANLQMETALYNRLSKSNITKDDVNELSLVYNWNVDTTEEEKTRIIECRKELVANTDKALLFGKIIDMSDRMFSSETNEEARERKSAVFIEDTIERYITKESDFVSLFVDRLGYVCYRENTEGAVEKRLLVGRSVYFLNYVSFSYDSRYLAFAAKLAADDFRNSQDGVFEIFDLENGEVVDRTEDVDDQQLWAVWMTMFSKTGDVAFYDSKADVYLKRKSDNYEKTEKIPGKSLLCFSPSGKYLACSDQNYVDYAHHPNENWGHQPSGNVFVYSTDNLADCLIQFNDLGDGVSGLADRASVSSAAFSQDESKLLVVGKDGVVVVRNLHYKMTVPSQA